MGSDWELIRAWTREGSEEAFAEIVRRHGAMVYASCLRFLGDRHAAEDAAQAVFVVLVRKARSLRSGVDLSSWLYGVARRVAMTAARSAARRTRREEDAGMIRSSARAGKGAGDGLGDDFDRELARLPGGERQAVILRYLEGRSQEEAAEIAGCPRGTLSRRASRGLERLRSRLAGRGVAVSAAALAGTLSAQASVQLPAALLPSLLATPGLAAVGVASGGPSGSKAALLAKGAMKAMFWTKVKIATAVLCAASAVGVGTPFAYRALAAGTARSGSKAGDTALGRLAASLKPGQMKPLKTIGLTRKLGQSWYDWDHDKNGKSIYGAQKMFNIFTGGWANDAKWDPETRQVLFVGIGHYAAMKFVTYSADTNKWTLEAVPTPLDPRNPKADQCPGKPGKKTWGRGHTYDLMAISPEHRQFVLRWSRGLNVYHIDNKKWKVIRSLNLGWDLPRDQIEYFPEMKGYIAYRGREGGAVLLCTPPEKDGGQWRRRSLGSAGGIAMHGVMEYNPVHKVMVFGGGTPAGNFWRLDAEGKLKRLKPPPGCICCVPRAKFMCDPVSGEYIVRTEKTEKTRQTPKKLAPRTYAYHPIRDEWTEMPKLRLPKGLGTAVNTYGVLMITTGGQVLVYKHKPVWPDDVPGKGASK